MNPRAPAPFRRVRRGSRAHRVNVTPRRPFPSGEAEGVATIVHLADVAATCAPGAGPALALARAYVVRAGYVVRPYDLLADRRRWAWESRTACPRCAHPRYRPRMGPLTIVRDLAERGRAWLLAPLADLIIDQGVIMSDQLTALQTAVARSGATTAAVALLIPDLRGKITALTTALEQAQANGIDAGQLAAISASLDASTDALAQAIAPAINDENIPTGDVPAPDAVNPATGNPTDVPGAVPAGAPLGEDVDPDARSDDQSPGADAVAAALENAVAPID